MKILIVTGGHLPIPAVKGGAVETLIEDYLDENEIKYKDKIDVISVDVPESLKPKLKKYKYTNFIYLKNKTKNSLYNIWYRLNRKLNRYIGDYFLKALIKTIKHSGKEYDLILCENEPQYTLLLKKYFKTKLILHLHNDTLNKDCKFYDKMVQCPDKILAISNFLKSRVAADEKCEVVYNGIDFNAFKDKGKSIDLKDKYNIGKTDFVYAYIGRVVPEKGVSELVEAFKLLNQKYTNTKLLIIGGPNMAHKVTHDFYEKITKQDNPNIIFTGYIDNKLLHNYYNLFDVQVIPSIINEAFGLVALEALTFDKRIIASDSGALPEIIDKEYGVIVNRDNLSNNLYKAMAEEYLHPKHNSNCLKRLQNYSKEKYTERLHDSLQ